VISWFLGPAPSILTAVFASVISTAWAQSNVVYFNNFDGPPGSSYPEWSSSAIRYESKATPPGSGTLPPPAVTNAQSPNGVQRFLGEFGGPAIGSPADPGYNRTRVEQTITLTLTNLPPHHELEISFDLLILKSWDGNSETYGPDRWSLNVQDGPSLLQTTFSNNPKIEKEGSYQDYPNPKSLPHTGAVSINTLGYKFFGDSIYRLKFKFPHHAPELRLHFNSSLFEGKGTPDESWGLDNVSVVATFP
jgi:hypothetical protein